MANQLAEFATNFVAYMNDIVSRAKNDVKNETASLKFTDLNGFLNLVGEVANEIADDYISQGVDNLNKMVDDYVEDLKKQAGDGIGMGSFLDAIRKAISFADYKNYDLVLSMLEATITTYKRSGAILISSCMVTDAIIFCQLYPSFVKDVIKKYNNKDITNAGGMYVKGSDTKDIIEKYFKDVVASKYSAVQKVFLTEEPEDIIEEIFEQLFKDFAEHVFKFIMLCVSLNPMYDEKLDGIKHNYDNSYENIRKTYKQLKSRFKSSINYVSETGKSITTEDFEKEKKIATEDYNKVRKDALKNAKEFTVMLGDALKAPTPAEVLQTFYYNRFKEMFDYMDDLKSMRNNIQSVCDALSAGSALPLIDSGFTDTDINKFYKISEIMEDVLRGSTYNINSDGGIDFSFESDNVGALRLRRSSKLNTSSAAYSYLFEKYTELTELISSIKDYSGTYKTVNDPFVASILVGTLTKLLKLVDVSGIKSLLLILCGKANMSSFSIDSFKKILEKNEWQEDDFSEVEKMCQSLNLTFSNYAGDFISSATSLDGLTSDAFEEQITFVAAQGVMFPEMLISTPLYIELVKINGTISAIQGIQKQIIKIQTTLRNMQMAANDAGILNEIASVSDMLTPDGSGLLALDVTDNLKDWLRVQSWMPSWLKKEKPGEGEVGKMSAKDRLTKIIALVKNMKKIYKMIMPK